MNDDEAWEAPNAAVAIASIDPSVKIGPRLAEFVTNKHPNWYFAAFHLSKLVEPIEAHKILSKAYQNAEDDSERQALIQALNQISILSENAGR